MDCQTVKMGTECPFMTTAGCSFNGGSCHPIAEQCEGCNHIIELNSDKFCRVFPDPTAKWAYGSCNFATHIKREIRSDKHKLNPLKASKRRNGK